jgi:hypothetical protein
MSAWEPTCTCFFCENGRTHPATHVMWYRISDQLLVTESLLDSDRVQLEACGTCGHKRRFEP